VLKRPGFVRGRQKGIFAALIALAIVVTTPVAWSYYSSQREAAAQARLAQVIHTFNQTVNSRSGKDAKEGFERVVVEARKLQDEYGSSPAARLAKYYLAISEENLGHTDRCIQNLEELIREGDPTMKPLAQFALGGLYKNHGDMQKAMAIHKQLEESGAYNRHAAHPGGRPPS
jgi:predicted negative regulator of RcsB-dependent stress response